MIVNVEEREYARLLGYPWGKILEGDVSERAVEAAEWYSNYGNPQVYCVTLDDTTIPFFGKGAVAAVTAGGEVDTEVKSRWDAGRVDEAYFLDRYAAGVVEKLASQLGSYRSPGTAGMPLEEQWTLFSYLAPLKPTIEILPSGMLRPKHSQLALVSFEFPVGGNPCTRCDLAGCTFRRRAS